MDPDNPERLPLRKLAKLVYKLSPQQIRRLPLNRLPQEIPEAWISEFNADKANALRDLRTRMHDPKALASERAADATRVGNALSWLRRPTSLSHWLDELLTSIDATERAFSRWREHNERLSDGGSWQSVAASGSEISMESNEGLEFSVLMIRCKHLEKSLRAHEPTVAKYTRLVAALDKRAQRGELPRFALDILVQARENLTRLQDCLSRTRMLRLYTAHNEMLAVRQKIESLSDRKRRLDQNIGQVTAEIRRARGWLRRLSRHHDADQLVHLNELKETMQAEKLWRRVDVSDRALEGWINALVDASIDSNCQALARSRIDAARTLLISLIKYRRRTAKAQVELQASANESVLAEVTDELQQFLHKSCASIKPDVLLEFRAQQGMFHARLQQLQNQLISEFLATTSPRYMIET